MKKSITFILTLVVCVHSYGQSQGSKSENTIGAVFSPGFKSANETIYTFGLRGTREINKYFSAGLEASYLQFMGAYGNSDAFGGIGFARLTPCDKGFFAELGFQYYKTISSARSTVSAVYFPFVSFGYKVKLKERVHVELQFRPFTYRGSAIEYKNTLNTNIASKCFIGLNYSF